MFGLKSAGPRGALIAAFLGCAAFAAAEQVIGWGTNSDGQLNLPTSMQSNVVAVSAGDAHTLALRSDGSVVQCGYNIGLPLPTAAQSGVIAISAGTVHSLALKSDGTVIAWGRTEWGDCKIPASATDVVAISGGYFTSLALKRSGRVIAWGRNSSGQTTVPLAAKSHVIGIAAGHEHSAALKDDGSVVVWGGNAMGQRDVPAAALSGVKAIAAGYDFTLALKTDGSVVAWGDNTDGQCSVPLAAQSNVIAIAGGMRHALALKADGRVVAWGDNTYYQLDVPDTARTGVSAIAAGSIHSVVLRETFMSFDPSTVWAGDSALGTVRLAEPAPDGGAEVALTSNVAIVHVPASVTVPAGQTTATFPLTTDMYFGAGRTAIVSTTYGGTRVATPLTINAHSVQATFSPRTFVVGSNQALSFSVTLDGTLGSDTVFNLSGPAALHLPSTITVPAGERKGTVSLTPDTRLPFGTVTATVKFGGPVVTTADLITTPMTAQIVLDESLVLAGNSVGAKVHLLRPTLNAMKVVLECSDTTITIPSSVTVPAGQQEAPFSIAVDATATSHTGAITTWLMGFNNVKGFKIQGNKLVDMTLSPASVKGGDSVTGTVTLYGTSNADLVVSLTSSKPSVAQVPATVTIPAGHNSATFTITTSATAKITGVTITATRESTLNRTLTVNP